ncbi:PREDICTED: uncharacterized protein LOC109474377 [Branchiostoma belcheri]|uniref:Uncharacterized protein LOC109474377 n=1 Tax=Branchiostoma belcheri TaxID=7741 RepID=A0A6P4ZGN8_BRABE|nr:PREDICTED: uncharacterized protein LOC109474377 [Branchiostoma belcheri]
MSDFESFRLLVCNIQPSTLSLKLTETTSTNLSGSLGPGDILQNIRFLDIRGVNLTTLAPSGLVRFKTLEWLRILCICLRSKYNDYIDEHVMAELRSNNQPGNAPENQADGATADSTAVDPYYSTIKDEDLDETVSPYGMAKAGAQYGRGKKRSRSVRENAIAGPKSRSEQCKCYNQRDREDTTPDNGDTEERDAS